MRSTIHFRTRRAGLLLALAALALLLVTAASASAAPNKIRFMRNAYANFDSYTCSQNGVSCSTPAEQQWMRDHYWRMRGYSPWYDASHGSESAINWAPPSHVYSDLYAIYRDTKGTQPNATLLNRHPTWVLRDRADNPNTAKIEGRRLYIPFQCDDPEPGCAEFAADIGNPAFRRWWIRRMQGTLDLGYVGVYIDDVNMDWRISYGSGAYVRPWDPRTHKRMTLDHWRKYVTIFVEQIRAAFPNAEIIHNGFYWQNRTNPWVKREIAAANFLELERGFNDDGLTGQPATKRFALRRLLAYIAWLHQRRKSVILEPHFNRPTMSGQTPTEAVMAARREQEIAGYYMIWARRDSIVADFQSDPPRTGGTNNWSPMWETDMGSPKGSRFMWSCGACGNGVMRRNFDNGIVLYNMPQQPAHGPINFGHNYYRFNDTTQCWEPQSKVTLRRTPAPWQNSPPVDESSSQGAVLLKAPPASQQAPCP